MNQSSINKNEDYSRMGSDLGSIDKGAKALDTMNNTVQNTTGKTGGVFGNQRGSNQKNNSITPGLDKRQF